MFNLSTEILSNYILLAIP